MWDSHWGILLDDPHDRCLLLQHSLNILRCSRNSILKSSCRKQTAHSFDLTVTLVYLLHSWLRGGLPDLLFGIGALTTSKLPGNWQPANHGLVDDQLKGLEMALSADQLMLLHGPPGRSTSSDSIKCSNGDGWQRSILPLAHDPHIFCPLASSLWSGG